MHDLNTLCEENETLAHLVWKARHQRKLTDEQILYFLERCTRWDMLPHYSTYLKRIMDEELALKQLRQDFHLGDTPSFALYWWTEDGEAETCTYESVDIQETMRCYHCDQMIPGGSSCVRLRPLLQGEDRYLHQECARKGVQVPADMVRESGAGW